MVDYVHNYSALCMKGSRENVSQYADQSLSTLHSRKKMEGGAEEVSSLSLSFNLRLSSITYTLPNFTIGLKYTERQKKHHFSGDAH